MARKRSYRFHHRPAGCLTPNEAGTFVGVTCPAVKNRIRAGNLKATRTSGGYNWIKKSDLTAKSFRSSKTRPNNAKRKHRKPKSWSAEAKKFRFGVEKSKPPR